MITKEGDAMYKLCRTDLSAQRQRKLERGLLEAMKYRRYEDISVSDLCQQLQIPRKSFYRYFDSKDGALHALIDHTLMEYVEWWSSLDPGNTAVKLESFFQFWKENRGLLDALEDSGLTRVLAERATSFSCSDSMLLARINPCAQDAQVYSASFWVSGLTALALSWFRRGFAESPAQMAQIAAGIISGGLPFISSAPEKT